MSTTKYNVTFGGTTIETTVTDSGAAASAWVLDVSALRRGVVGLDVEWRPHTVAYMSNRAATLQLCTGYKCLILQLFYMDAIPSALKSFLMNPNFTFVGVQVDEDVAKLREEYGLGCARFMDIRAEFMARRSYWFGKPQPGLKDLARVVCGLHMEKPLHVCRSDWQARVLSVAQVEYACIDAFASYKIGHNLISQN